MIQTKEALRIEQLDGDELAAQLFDFASVKARQVSLYYVDKDGGLKFRFHKYQKKAMRSKRRFVLLLGGTQSGKTSFGSIWLHREIALRGAGDYLAVAPTYPLMKKKMLPEFLRLFEDTLNLGSYNKTDRIFTVSGDGEVALFGESQETKTVIHFGHAQDPDSLESATAKGAWLDECGQKKFKLGSFEAIMRRLSLSMGRVLMTTTPYYLGWLKQKFWDVWKAGKALAESIAVISFPSIANPSFPQAEYERAKRTLPPWKFKMFYQAIFTRPAGLIYDCFDELKHKVEAFKIPDSWPRFTGHDFGGVNTAAVFVAQKPDTNEYYLYREYWAGGRTSKQHATHMRTGEPAEYHPVSLGGAKSEGQWRQEYGAAGWFIGEPVVSEVEVGIDRVYSAFSNDQLFVFDTCTHTLDELSSYSRELDEEGEPTEKIENKNAYHLLDALRYIASYFVEGASVFL